MPTFPRTARLLHPRDFRHVFAQPTRRGDRLVTVLARANGGRGARLGLAVARRRIPRSVDRNLFKRVIRERFRIWRDRLDDLDIVVLPQAAAARATRAQLHASIDRQLGLLAGPGTASRHGADTRRGAE